MTPHCSLIGASVSDRDGAAMLLGVGCGATLNTACSLIFTGAFRRLRVNISADQALELAAVLGDELTESTSDPRWGGGPIHAVRDGADVSLTVDGLHLRLTGSDLQRDLRRALERRASDQPAISGELTEGPHVC